MFKLLFFVYTKKKKDILFLLHLKLLWILSTTIMQDYQFKYISHSLSIFNPEPFLFSAPTLHVIEWRSCKEFFLFNCSSYLITFHPPRLEDTLQLITLPKTAALIAKLYPSYRSFSSTLIWLTAAFFQAKQSSRKGIEEI